MKLLTRMPAILAAVFLVGASAMLLVPEMREVSDSAVDSPTTFTRAVDIPPEYVAMPSLLSQQRQMARCDDNLNSIFALLMGPDVAARVAQACLVRADEILASAGSNGPAWVAKAAAHVILGEKDAAIAALESGEAAAPNEGWLAARRVRLWVRLVVEKVDVSSSAARRDVLTLLESDRYNAALAQMYKANTGAQDWLIGILDTGPDGDKSRFLGAVRRLNEGGGA